MVFRGAVLRSTASVSHDRRDVGRHAKATPNFLFDIAIASASYRKEKPQFPEIKILFFAYFLRFSLFYSYFRDFSVFLFCSWPTWSQI